MRKSFLYYMLWAGTIGAINSSVSPLHADNGSEAASFLEIPVGAGPAALGGAYTTLATDAYAPVWNMAGLAEIRSYQIAAQHLSFLESINYEYASFVMPFGKNQGVGVFAQYLGTGDVDETNTLGDTVGSFSNSYAAYGISYGSRLTSKLSLGASGKLIRANLADVSASAVALDGGLLYTASPRWTLGASVQNLGTKMKFIEQEDSLPLAFRGGVSFKPTDHWTVALDGVYPKEADASARLGVEWRPLSSLAFRSGFRSDTLKENSAMAAFSLGVGINLWGQEFAYAWVPYGVLGNTQYFSLLLRFGEDRGEREERVSATRALRREAAMSKQSNSAMKKPSKNPGKSGTDYQRMSDDDQDQLIFEMLDDSERKHLRKGSGR